MKQVTVVSILMIVEGSLECLIGLILLIAVPVTLMENTRGSDREAVAWVLYIGLGLLPLGALRIIAGVKNLKYQGRTFGVVALALGVLTILLCRLLRASLDRPADLWSDRLPQRRRAPSVRYGEQGATPEQIKATFG